MDSTIDAVGQWLTQLPMLGQVAVLLIVLLPVGGFAAYLLIGAIDYAGGYVHRYRLKKRTAPTPQPTMTRPTEEGIE